MKKWIRFFCLSFFSDKISKEGAKRGYTNVFIGIILSFVFLWAGFVGGDMLPFASHYNKSRDFQETVRAVLANSDLNKRIIIEMENGRLKAKKFGEEYTESLLVNTFENDADKENYSTNGYNVIIDSRPADTLAEVEAYCISNDGKNLVISYEEYLTLSEVARLNFDFKLRYTGNELVLDDAKAKEYRKYAEELGDEQKSAIEKLDSDLLEGRIEKTEYDIEVYKIYFSNYYPDITDYESTSEVPLLRNYYYHQYIKEGECKYLFIFDDYLAGSFETKNGTKYSFYGFYTSFDDGVLTYEGSDNHEATKAADDFIKMSYSSAMPLTVYAYAMNVFSLIPFIALMPMVVALLAYSVLMLRGVEGISSFGGVFKIIGSYVWFSGVISAILTVIIAFFASPSTLTTLPLIIFFIALAIRSMVFAINEANIFTKQSQTERREA